MPSNTLTDPLLPIHLFETSTAWNRTKNRKINCWGLTGDAHWCFGCTELLSQDPFIRDQDVFWSRSDRNWSVCSFFCTFIVKTWFHVVVVLYFMTFFRSRNVPRRRKSVRGRLRTSSTSTTSPALTTTTDRKPRPVREEARLLFTTTPRWPRLAARSPWWRRISARIASLSERPCCLR